MSQLTSPLALTGSLGPVSFTPRAIGPDITILKSLHPVASQGDIKLSLEFSDASAKRPTTRVGVSMDYPVMSGTPIPTKVGGALFKGYFVLPTVMTVADRLNFELLVNSALNDAIVRAYVKDLDPIWG